jgi:mRNA interferase RelE/StbE
MESYRIEISATAERQIKKLAPTEQMRVLKAIKALEFDTRPRGCRKMQGYVDTFRIRVATYRILYSVEDTRLLILVLKIGHRRAIYQ